MAIMTVTRELREVIKTFESKIPIMGDSQDMQRDFLHRLKHQLAFYLYCPH